MSVPINHKHKFHGSGNICTVCHRRIDRPSERSEYHSSDDTVLDTVIGASVLTIDTSSYSSGADTGFVSGGGDTGGGGADGSW